MSVQHSLKTYIIVVASTYDEKVSHKFFTHDEQSGLGFAENPNHANHFKCEEDALKAANLMVEEPFSEWGRERTKYFSLPSILRAASCERYHHKYGLYTFQIGIVMVETAFNPDDLFEMKGTVIKRVHVDFKTYERYNTKPEKVVKWIK